MVPFINKFNLILILHILFTLTSARKNNLGRVFGGEEAKARKDNLIIFLTFPVSF